MDVRAADSAARVARPSAARRPTRRRRLRGTPSRSNRSAALRRSLARRAARDRRRPAAPAGRASAAGSTSSNATARPSTSRRPKPFRRSASSVAATALSPRRRRLGAPPPVGAAGRLRRRRSLVCSSSTSGAVGGARPTPSTTGRSNPSRSRVPAGQLAELPRDDLGRLAHDLAAAVAAERAADAREEQPHVVVDLGRRADRRARVADAVLLPDRDRRRDAVDAIDVRLLHPLEELPRVGRQRLDVAPLPFGVDRVEGERRLPRPAHAGDDDQLAERQRDVDVLEVVRARAAHDELGGRFDGRRGDGFGHLGTARRRPGRSRSLHLELLRRA